jgi:hypothetical protein
LSEALCPLLEVETPNINHIIKTLNEFLDPNDVKRGLKYSFDYFSKAGIQVIFYFRPGINTVSTPIRTHACTQT